MAGAEWSETNAVRLCYSKKKKKFFSNVNENQKKIKLI